MSGLASHLYCSSKVIIAVIIVGIFSTARKILGMSSLCDYLFFELVNQLKTFLTFCVKIPWHAFSNCKFTTPLRKIYFYYTNIDKRTVDVFVITQYDIKSTLKNLQNFLKQKMRNYFTRVWNFNRCSLS